MSQFLDTRRLFLGRTALTVWIAALGFCNVTLGASIRSGTEMAPPKSPEEFPALDTRRLYALGMIETGNNDKAVGTAGEISRYQLSPPVWHAYSKSRDYHNPEISEQVARQHWAYLAAYFREKCGHAPNDFDMYVLWNTRFGYYARRGFSKQQLASIVKDRAQRFVNLVNRKES